MRFMIGAIFVEVGQLEYEFHERLDWVESMLMVRPKLIATLLDGFLSLSNRPKMMDVGPCTGECEVFDAQISIVEECRGYEDQHEEEYVNLEEEDVHRWIEC